ncbi:MAG: SCP2 sterol-binding domain-containing protein [Dehalococcoidia bacterium]
MTTPLPPRELFPRVMEKTLELTGQKVPTKTVQGLAKIFTSLCWEFPDYGLSIYTLLDEEGRFSYVESIEGEADAQITMKAEQLHSVVYGRANLPKMFLTGKIKVRGLPRLKLFKFVPLLGPFLDSYKEACEGAGSGPSP